MKPRNRSYYRDVRDRHIKRKLYILRDCLHDPYTLKFDGMASKNKIHCSCILCAFHETPISDKRILLKLDNELSECDEYVATVERNRIRKRYNKYRLR